MAYIDGFLLVVPRKKLPAYLRLARKSGAIWREHGALEYRECVGDDLETKYGTTFPKLLKLKPDEVAIFAWIVYKSRADRDRVNQKVMKDSRIINMMDPKDMPFEMKRMSYGGFKIAVDR